MELGRRLFVHNLRTLCTGRSFADVSRGAEVPAVWLRRVATRGLPRPCKLSSPNLTKVAAYLGVDVGSLWQKSTKVKTFLKMLGHPAPRVPGDSFATPRKAIEALLDVERFGKLVLEPCCGSGSISKVLIERGHDVVSKDLFDWGYGEIGEDFLTFATQSVDAVITNPPFQHGTQFALKALQCTKERQGKVAMLNRLLFLEGRKRKPLFVEYPLSRVLVFSERLPRMHRPDYQGEEGRGLLAFAWYVWDWTHKGEALLSFL